MNHRHIRVPLFVAVLLAATSLPAQKVDIEFDQAIAFTHYKTFAIRGGQLNSKDPSLNNDLVRKQIDADIEKALIAKGLTKSFGKPDIAVRYHLGARRKTEVDRYPAGWRGRGTRTVRSSETEGTLTVDLHDTTNQALIWRAVASEEKSSASDISKKLDDMVRKSFDKYPPKK